MTLTLFQSLLEGVSHSELVAQVFSMLDMTHVDNDDRLTMGADIASKFKDGWAVPEIAAYL